MGQMLSVSGLVKTYDVRKGAFSKQKAFIKAVDNVSFTLNEGETLGIVGESGSGKSTLARCLLLLERPDRGSVRFLDHDILHSDRASLMGIRRQMQIIFQDPYSSLNPRKKIGDAIGEPLLFYRMEDKKTVRGRVAEILRDVGLDDDFMNKYPHEMSGGQRQRVAIGRALALKPSLFVADEPVSSLDVSIQAQIINLFADIREGRDISMIFISHDLNVVRFIADEILVMYRGRIVEMGNKDEVFSHPLHPYTQMLLAASQGNYPTSYQETRVKPDGTCGYYQRCPMRGEICAREQPSLTGTKEHSVACFYGRA